MAADWESHLKRWILAGVLDTETADRIRVWEREHARPGGLRWPIWIALAFGALLLGAGVLLFVSAHWDELAPSQRMALVVLMVGASHAGGSVAAPRFEGLSVALHTVGTITLGAGIALAGQIFNLSEHWPSAILMWAAGAALSWAILRHWTQAALTAILIPYWLAGEWWVWSSSDYVPVAVGICALCFTYLSARRAPDDSALRKALGWIGGIALLPAVFGVALERWNYVPASPARWVGWSLAILLPMALAVVLRGRAALWTGVAIAWTLILAAIGGNQGDRLLVYLCGARWVRWAWQLGECWSRAPSGSTWALLGSPSLY